MTIPGHKLNISRFWFHIIVAFITDAILFGLVAIVFFFAGIKGIALIVLAGLFLFESILYAVLSGLLSRWSNQTVLSLRMVGLGLGRLIGLFAGGILGAALAGWIGGIVGAVVFYFLGRWAGSRLGILIGKYLEGFFQLDPPKEMSRIPASLRKRKLYIIFYGSVLLILFGCAFILSYYDGPIFLSDSKTLIYARIIMVVYSLLAIALQWLRGKNFFPHKRANKKAVPSNPQTPFFIIGLAFSIIPCLAGEILFIFGASLVELSVYCLASLISGLLWIIYRFPSFPKIEQLDIPPEEKIIQ
jgi:MFS family permease